MLSHCRLPFVFRQAGLAAAVSLVLSEGSLCLPGEPGSSPVSRCQTHFCPAVCPPSSTAATSLWPWSSRHGDEPPSRPGGDPLRKGEGHMAKAPAMASSHLVSTGGPPRRSQEMEGRLSRHTAVCIGYVLCALPWPRRGDRCLLPEAHQPVLLQEGNTTQGQTQLQASPLPTD